MRYLCYIIVVLSPTVYYWAGGGDFTRDPALASNVLTTFLLIGSVVIFEWGFNEIQKNHNELLEHQEDNE